MELDTRIEGTAVIVRGNYALRDWSGVWDDDYQGIVDIVVLAELEAATVPPPRGDLQITGIEINQATQAFRSNRHLDALNVQPDNSIPLIARKSTGLRVYVDYNAASGLPAIASLSGEVELVAGSGATVILAPLATIAPMRDSEINRVNARHTLNFIMPEAWCEGHATIRARVFDARSLASRSGIFQRPVRFREAPELRLVAVEITYTGQGMNVAPGEPAILASLGLTETLFPTPAVVVTGFQRLTFGEDFATAGGDGCGNAFGNLLDRLNDLVGDSDEYIFGFLPPGIAYGPAVGCARLGDSPGAGPVDLPFTIAHEFGHMFGRIHSQNDESYPQYGPLPRSSAGEIGFDPRNGAVVDPATITDIMTSGGGAMRWMSPYTNAALMTRLPPADEGGDAPDYAVRSAKLRKSRGEYLDDQLFLRMEIARDRKVSLNASFHYLAPGRAGGRMSGFSLDFVDEKGKVLSCTPLSGECVACHGECWPMKIRQRVRYPTSAHTMRVWEGRDLLLERAIPAAPQVELKVHNSNDGVRLDWATQSSADDQCYWYLIQGLDRGGVWRGLAQRQQETGFALPAKDALLLTAVRVLATEGVSTGISMAKLVPNENRPPVVDVALLDGSERGGALVVHPLRSDGIAVLAPTIQWFDSAGGEVGRGRHFYPAVLGPGDHVVRAVMRDTGFGQATRSFYISQPDFPDAGLCTCEPVAPWFTRPAPNGEKENT